MSLKLLILLHLFAIVIATGEEDPYWFMLAMNKTTLLSTTKAGSHSFKAVDGKVIREPGECAMAEDGASASWFAVDFGQRIYPAMIVFHMYDGGPYSGTQIRLGDSQDYSSNPIVKTLNLLKFGVIQNYRQKGRYLSVHYPYGPLGICEVHAIRIPVDSLSVGKPAETPNPILQWPPGALTDLNWNSLASSRIFAESWIRVDLLDTHWVQEIILVQYPGHVAKGSALAIGSSLKREGKLNPQCNITELALGESKSFRCNLRGRYVVFFSTSARVYTRLTQIVVNPTHLANLAEAKPVEFPAAESGFDQNYFATDSFYGQSIITKDIGTGHWVRLELGNSNPVAKIFLINTKHVAYKDLMTAFELRVGDSIEENGNNNPLCLPGVHSLKGKTTGSYFCEPRATGKYVNIRQTVPGKPVAIAEIAVYSESSPMIKDREKDREIWKKQSATLNCASHGYPPPVVSWLKDDVVVSSSDTLTVNKSGIYECWANNTHGEDFKPVHVSITSDARVCVGSVEVNYDLGGKDANVYPMAEETFLGYNWYRFSDITSMQYLKMDTQTPNLKKCQTQMSGVHPKLSDGVVTRSVCVRNEQGDCQQQFYVRVRNCGIYYVYNLPSTLQFQGFSHCFRKETKQSGNPSIATKVGGNDRALINHVLQREEEIQDSIDCLMMCSVTTNCKSFNYGKKEKVCELNSSSKKKSPKDFASRRGFGYFEKGKGMVARRINEL